MNTEIPGEANDNFVAEDRDFIPSSELVTNISYFPDGTREAFKEYLMNESTNPTIFSSEKYEAYCSHLSQEDTTVRAPTILSLNQRNAFHQHFRVIRELYMFDGFDLYTKASKGRKRVASHDNAFDIIIRAHEESRPGESRHRLVTETHKCVKRAAYGILLKDIKWLLLRCSMCNKKAKEPNKRQPYIPPQNVTFGRLQIDFAHIGSTMTNGFKWVLILRDHMTNYMLLHALKEKDAKEVALLLSDFIEFHGPPRVIQYEDQMTLDGAVAILLYNEGIAIERGDKRDDEVARYADYMRYVVKKKISNWVELKGGECWKRSIQCVERSVNSSSSVPQSLLNAFELTYGPIRNKQIVKTFKKMRPRDLELHNPDFQDFDPSNNENPNDHLVEAIRGYLPEEIITALENHFPRETTTLAGTCFPSISSIEEISRKFPETTLMVFTYQATLRERMKVKYAAKHTVQLFEAGNYVLVKFPEDVRPPLGDKRFYARVTEGSGSLYKVISEFGLLDRMVSTSDMNVVPQAMYSHVDKLFENAPIHNTVTMGFIGANMATSNMRFISCKCKGACVTVSCKCKKNQLKCSQYCGVRGHLNCRNMGTILDGTQQGMISVQISSS